MMLNELPVDYKLTDYPKSDCCKLPPFLLKHANKLRIGFFIATVALASSAGSVQDPTLQVVLGSLTLASTAGTLFFCKQVSNISREAEITASVGRNVRGGSI